MKRLIINADDFGLSDAVSRGIADSMIKGVVCSTSLMACDSESLRSPSEWRTQLSKRVGVHLQLTGGIPRTEPERLRSLLSPEGRFAQWPTDIQNPKRQEILLEWHAQVNRVLEYGFTPTHIDTHHHVHTLPMVFDAYCEIARFYGLPARTRDATMTCRLRCAGVRCADLSEIRWFKKRLSVRGLTKLIDSDFKMLGENATVELMCHPGYVDSELRRKSTYAEERETELAALCDPSLRAHLKKEGIVLVDRAADREAEWC
jgi:chitin disaccharide deacetylase